MSPLVQPPARGYSDWQRVSNYDTGLLYNAQEINNAVSFTSPIEDVSRYAATGLFVNMVAGNAIITLSWFLDAGGTEQAGFRTFVTSSLMNNGLQARILNLGPFVTISGTPFGGNYSIFLDAWGTNRQYPLEVVPSHPAILDVQGQNIGANSNAFVYPNDYYAGPVAFMVEMGTASSVFQTQFLTGTNTWDIIDIHEPATNAFTPYTVVVPPGAWRVEVFNQAAAATTFYLTGIASMTGAS